MIYKKLFLVLILSLNLISFAKAADQSIYHSQSTWKDETNKEFPLVNLKGKKVVVAMAYTSCQATCPMIISKLKTVESLFNQKNIQVEVVVITFDPGFDTPERNMTFYREKMGIKKTNWHFLTGSENDTRKISMLLGIKFSVNPETKAIIHDSKIILLNEVGEIEKRLKNLDDNPANLVN